jgi:hypothetical protein
MALEYEDLTVDPAVDETSAILNAKAADGWRVHTAYSPTRFLLERGSTATGAQPARHPASPHR